MKVAYTGDYPAICLSRVWNPREVKDIPDEEAVKLVSTNANFVQVDEEGFSRGVSE